MKIPGNRCGGWDKLPMPAKFWQKIERALINKVP